MRCPYCNTTFPPLLAGQAAQFRCAHCGGRLFTWLGDPFGVRDFPEPQQARGNGQTSGGAAGNNGWVITLVVVAILAYFLFFATPFLLSLLIH